MINNGTIAIDQYNNTQRRKWQSHDLTNKKHNFLSVSTVCCYSIFKTPLCIFITIIIIVIHYNTLCIHDNVPQPFLLKNRKYKCLYLHRL